MAGSYSTRIVGALCVLGLIVAVAPAQPAGGATADTVAAAWKAREDSVKSFRIRWEQTVTYPKGSYSQAYPADVPKGKEFPPTEHSAVESLSVEADGERFRFEYSGEVYSTVTNGWDKLSFVALYDGKTGSRLQDIPEIGYTRVNRSKDAPSSIRCVETVPVCYAFRPAHPRLGPADLDKFQTTGRTLTIRGRNTIELGPRKPVPGAESFIWVDPERGFVVVRTHQSIPNHSIAAMQYDIDYRAGPNGVWLPAGWVWTEKGRRGLIRTVRANVKECEINLGIPDATFDTTPPPGSQVTEFENGTGKEWYVIRPDGSRRDVLPGESRRAYAELVTTEPGELIGQPRSWWYRNLWTVIGAAAFILGIVGAAVLRARARRPT